MIRVIDLGYQLDVEHGDHAVGRRRHFAIWRVEAMEFVEILGDQVWSSWDEFWDDCQVDGFRALSASMASTVRDVLPEWAR